MIVIGVLAFIVCLALQAVLFHSVAKQDPTEKQTPGNSEGIGVLGYVFVFAGCFLFNVLIFGFVGKILISLLNETRFPIVVMTGLFAVLFLLVLYCITLLSKCNDRLKAHVFYSGSVSKTIILLFGFSTFFGMIATLGLYLLIVFHPLTPHDISNGVTYVAGEFWFL